MKNLDKLGLETKKPPQIQGTRPGTADKRFVITVHPQKLI